MSNIAGTNQPAKKRVVVTVISDLVTDQRVHKVCRTLHENGYRVLLIGAKRRASLPLSARTYQARRIPMLFQKKIFFYAEFNIRLFFRLLFTRADIFLGNDLDVMPATFFASRIRRKPIVYDTHEYYMGMPELKGRPGVKKVWQAIESFIFPRLRHIYTICDSFCELYKSDYGKALRTVRNVPYLQQGESPPLPPELERRLPPPDKHFLLFQGAGINPERGVEELVLAMQWLEPEKYQLLIIGGGDIFERIKQMAKDNQLEDRITILPRIPFETLQSLTRRAHLGLSLDKPTNSNHIYGLPNKIFDYLHGGVPVLVSRLIELEKIVEEYQVGGFIENHQPEHIASRIREVFESAGDPNGASLSGDPKKPGLPGALLETWKKNTERARRELNWEKESRVILEIFKQVEGENS